MVDHLHGHASAVIRSGLQPYRHWRRYDFLGWQDQNVFHYILVLLGRMSDSHVTGTLAAAFQSFAYGGFAPAGGIFATLTSMGMLGFLMPLEVGLAAVRMLDRKIKQRDKFVAQLEAAETRLISRAIKGHCKSGNLNDTQDKRESVRLPHSRFMWLLSIIPLGERVDLIYYYRREISRLNIEIAEDQHYAN